MTLFNKILESPRAWTVFIMSFISSFEIIKVFVAKPSMSFEFLHQSLKKLLLFLIAKGIATFIKGTANLLNSVPKNPPDWVILEI